MAIKFSETTKHGGTEFFPGVSLAFEDPDAEPYFVAAGWAEPTKDAPVRTYTQEEVDIDPGTVFGSGPKAGQRVLEKSAKQPARTSSRKG